MKLLPFALCICMMLAGVSPSIAFQQPSSYYQTTLVSSEATSLLGTPLYPIPMSAETKARLDSQVAAARSDYEKDPNDADHIIWLGRRVAYLWRYRKAIDIFSQGIDRFPNDARMYRHRGHRYITVREFDKAIADLEKAAAIIRDQPDEIEPDGQPNKFNIPTSTLQSNIWYHLGLAYYLKGDFQKALPAYLECMKVSNNPDMFIATSDWLYMTYRRLGRVKDAQQVLGPIHENMNILENHSYHRRLLMYKGDLPSDSLLNPAEANDLDLATYGYGVGNWYLYNGEVEKAREIFEGVVAGNYWAAFGYVAAEAELRRMTRE